MATTRRYRYLHLVGAAISCPCTTTLSVDAFVSAPNVQLRTPSNFQARPAARTRLLPPLKQSNTDETCLVGENIVEECCTPSRLLGGTESQSSATTNLAKCICGAGSFALPHVFLEEGVLGGTLAITLCGILATWTMKSLSDSKLKASEMQLARGEEPIRSYVQLARVALGESASRVVFALTLCASLGVCSTYLVFIGSTLESMSCDATAEAGTNIVRMIAPNVSEVRWEVGAATVLYPLSLIRNYSVFAFTSALGVFAVVGGIVVTLLYGIVVDPGGGLGVALDSIGSLPLWPSSLSAAFGGSFGTICYLFAINFLTFPVMNSMRRPKEFDGAVTQAVAAVWVVNVAFAILALGFYREGTQDLVLANLDNGPYLSALKLLLCIDLLFTYPIVFSSGRQILENALIGAETRAGEKEDRIRTLEAGRAAIVAGAVAATFGLAQIGGFGAVANLVGGVAQGTLAFVMPPAIAVAVARSGDENVEGKGGDGLSAAGEVGQYALGLFGVSVVSAVTYFTFTEL